MRTFLAAALPASLCAQLNDIAERAGIGRAVPVQNLHMTLAFLDEQTDQTLADLHQELTQITAPRLDLQIIGLGTFGGRKPRIIHAEIEKTDALASLHRQIQTAARAVGITLNRGKFKPHVTLVRLGPQLPPQDHEKLAQFMAHHAAFKPASFGADRFGLYQSQLMPDGPIYDLMAEYPINT